MPKVTHPPDGRQRRYPVRDLPVVGLLVASPVAIGDIGWRMTTSALALAHPGLATIAVTAAVDLGALFVAYAAAHLLILGQKL